MLKLIDFTSINTADIYCSEYRVEGVCLLAGSGQDGPVGVFGR